MNDPMWFFAFFETLIAITGCRIGNGIKGGGIKGNHGDQDDDKDEWGQWQSLNDGDDQSI